VDPERASHPDGGQFTVVHQAVDRHLADPHHARQAIAVDRPRSQWCSVRRFAYLSICGCANAPRYRRRYLSLNTAQQFRRHAQKLPITLLLPFIQISVSCRLEKPDLPSPMFRGLLKEQAKEKV
jgi:hypothetical protein